MRSTAESPVVELLVPLKEFGEPETQRSSFPRDLLPGIWNTSIIHAVQSVAEILWHYYSPFGIRNSLCYNAKHLFLDIFDDIVNVSLINFKTMNVLYCTRSKRFQNSPSMASLRSVRVVRTRPMTRCILSSSWRRNIVMGWNVPIFCRLLLTCIEWFENVQSTFN